MKRAFISLIGCFVCLALVSCTSNAGSGSAQIGNWIWEDSNANGIQDEGEQGIDSVEMSLLSSEGAVIAQATTNEDGVYSFTGVEEGDYRLSIDAPSQWLISEIDQGGDDELDSDFDPQTGTTGEFHVAAGQSLDTLDGGLRQYYPEPSSTPEPTPTSTPEEPAQCRCTDFGVVLEPNPCSWPDATACSGWESLCHENGFDPNALFNDGTQLCAFGCCVILHCP